MTGERAEHKVDFLHHYCCVRIGVFALAAERAGDSDSIHWKCELGDADAADPLEDFNLVDAKEYAYMHRSCRRRSWRQVRWPGPREGNTGVILAPGTWHLAPGTWHLAPGTWHLAPGTWLLAHG
jgi:hypothetical protein